MEEQVNLASIVFIIPEQKYGIVLSHGAYASKIKYNNGVEEVVEFFDINDFIVSNEIGFQYTEEN